MAQPTPATDADPRSLHELAVDIATDIHKLALGLAHAGAPPKITAQIETPAGLYAQIAKGLAAGPIGGQPAQAGGQAEAAPAAPAEAAPPLPAGPQAGPGTPQAIAPAHGAIHNTLMQAHRDAVAARAAGATSR